MCRIHHAHPHTYANTRTGDELGSVALHGLELVFSRYCRRSVFDDRDKDLETQMHRALHDSVIGLSSVKQMATDFQLIPQVMYVCAYSVGVGGHTLAWQHFDVCAATGMRPSMAQIFQTKCRRDTILMRPHAGQTQS